MVSIFVVNIENFLFAIATPFAYGISCGYQTQFESSFIFYFVLWPSNLVMNTCSISVCASPTTGFLIFMGLDGSPAHDTGSFFPVGNPVAFSATKDPSTFYLGRSSVNRLRTNYALRVRVPFV